MLEQKPPLFTFPFGQLLVRDSWENLTGRCIIAKYFSPPHHAVSATAKSRKGSQKRRRDFTQLPLFCLDFCSSPPTLSGH